MSGFFGRVLSPSIFILNVKAVRAKKKVQYYEIHSVLNHDSKTEFPVVERRNSQFEHLSIELERLNVPIPVFRQDELPKTQVSDEVSENSQNPVFVWRAAEYQWFLNRIALISLTHEKVKALLIEFLKAPTAPEKTWREGFASTSKKLFFDESTFIIGNITDRIKGKVDESIHSKKLIVHISILSDEIEQQCRNILSFDSSAYPQTMKPKESLQSDLTVARNESFRTWIVVYANQLLLHVSCSCAFFKLLEMGITRLYHPETGIIEENKQLSFALSQCAHEDLYYLINLLASVFTQVYDSGNVFRSLQSK